MTTAKPVEGLAPAAVLAGLYRERAGCRFVGFREVAIPVFHLKLRAVLLESRPFPTVDEFLLRGLKLGLRDANALSSALGLDLHFVEKRLAELRRQELVDVRESSESVVLELSPKGKAAAIQLTARQLVERTLDSVPFHGWTRRPVPQYGSRILLTEREAQDQGLVPLRPRPSRPPTADEVDAKTLAAWLKKISKNRLGESPVVEILAVRAVLKPSPVRFVPGLLLQYEQLSGGRDAVSFVVDGQEDQSLSAALKDAQGRSVLDEVLRRVNRQETTRDELIRMVPAATRDTVRAALIPEGEAEAISVLEAKITVEEARQTKTTRVDTKKAQADEIAKLKAELAKKQSDAPRSINESDCHQCFYRALQQSQERLLIESAFIGRQGVGPNFVSQISRLINRGVIVHVLHGAGDQERRQWNSWKTAEQRLDELRRKFPGKFHLAVRETHAKQLVCDSEFAVCGSFNFLSYRPDKKQIRDERAILMKDKPSIEEVAADILRAF